MTKLFDATCSNCAGEPETTGGWSARDPSSLAPAAKLIVKFTLTAQTRRPSVKNAGPAWTLQSLFCTTTPGSACAKAGQKCPAEPGPGRGVEYETSIEPSVFRLLGRKARRCAGTRPQRNRAVR